MFGVFLVEGIIVVVGFLALMKVEMLVLLGNL